MAVQRSNPSTVIAPDESHGNENHSAKPANPASSQSYSLWTHGTQTIFLSLAVISIPLTLFTALLIGIVFHYRLQRNHPSSLSYLSSLTQDDEPNVYYVQFSATKLVLLASVSSSVAPILTSFFMTLLSYSVARRIREYSKARKLGELPTPCQLGLLITTVNDISSALWQWVKYVWGRKTNIKTVETVKFSVWGLTTINLFMYYLALCI